MARKGSDKPPAEQYISDVISGKITANKWVRLACERHRRDIKDSRKKEFPYRFSKEKGNHAIRFFTRYLRHSKGEWAGKIFYLEPWEQFIVWNLFGWIRKSDKLRRFRWAYIEIARKNGKSTLLAGIGLYLFIADEEPGAEIYTAAMKRDQARIVHSEATRMVQSSATLRNMIGIYKNNLHHVKSGSKYEPLGADSDTCDGLNVHGAIIDELHAHKTRGMWDVLETATAARRQPLQVAITTAGFDKNSICWEIHDYIEKILENTLQDESFFGMIYTLDKDDDWQEEKNWVKANPNLNVSVKREDLLAKAGKVRELPSSVNSFLRLHMNVWTESETRWIESEAWNGCAFPVDSEGLRGRTCYGGLDLSSTRDITAWALCFPPETDEGLWRFIWRFFIPADNMAKRIKRDRVPFDAWVRDGWMTATPGNVVDYHYVTEQIRQDAQAFDVREIAFDRWGAAKIMVELEGDGMTVVPFGQGFASMSSPCKEFEKIVSSRKLAHGKNPVMNWMIANTVVRRDPADNIKPDKEKSTERIDGVVAAVMALDRGTRGMNEKSVYESRGVLTF